MPIERSDKEKEASSGASSRSHPHLVSYVMAKLVVNTPVMILALTALALVWGVAARIIYEAFLLGWNLIGF